MTPQEQQMLSDLLNKIAGTPAPIRDADAETLIQKTIGGRPDALYLLTQIALVNDIALKQAHQQIHDLQQRAASQPAPAFSSSPWGQQAPQQQQAPQPQPAPPPASSSFLHNALATASGVIAGEVAFSAMRSLFGGGMTGAGGGGFLSGAPGSETIVNNYYGDSNSDDDSSASDDSTDDNDVASSDDSGDDSSSDFS